MLELIAAGKTSRPEIESILECETGGYIARLVDVYGLLNPVRPINAKPGGRRQKYAIIDPFLKFWFCFIWPHRSAVVAGNFDYLKACFARLYEINLISINDLEKRIVLAEIKLNPK